MPENETLLPSPRHLTRWDGLRDRASSGETPNSLVNDIRTQFYRMLRSVFNKWNRAGVSPEALFRAAANNPELLRSLVAQTRHDEHARLLLDILSSSPSSLESVLREFLDSEYNRVRDYLQLDSLESELPQSFHDAIDQILARLLRLLAADPSKVPPLPRRDGPPPDIGDILGENLF